MFGVAEGLWRVEALEPLPLTALSERAGAAKRGPWRGHRPYSADQVPRLSDAACSLWHSTVRTAAAVVSSSMSVIHPSLCPVA